MGNLHKRGSVYYADFVDRTGRRIQRSLRTSDREVAKARLRDLELATTNSGPHASELEEMSYRRATRRTRARMAPMAQRLRKTKPPILLQNRRFVPVTR
jgi:hypothetical protein